MTLLLALAMAEALESPFHGELRPLRQKVAALFPPQERRLVSRLRARILIGSAASAAVLASVKPAAPSTLRTLKAAFVQRRVLELAYVDGAEQRSRRTVEPHCLLLNPPVWYALVHDQARNAARTLRLDRMSDVTLLERTFTERPVTDLTGELGAMFAPL